MILPASVGSEGPLTVRAWEPADAADLADEVARSREHLARWMEWALQPSPDAAVYRERIGEWRSQREAGGDATYGILLDGRVAGGCGLHGHLGPGGLEIGYWLGAASTGRGVMTRTVRMLTDLAFSDPDIDRVEIHHDAANRASGAVPERLGFVVAGQSPRPRAAPADSGVERRWRMTREAWAARDANVRATSGSGAADRRTACR